MGENARLHLASIADVPTDAELALHVQSGRILTSSSIAIESFLVDELCRAVQAAG